ncbi:MAG: MFS transporter, partial [Chloroflexota bacterium]
VYWTASLLQQSAGWMQNVAVAWLLLEMTNSPLLLGLNWLFQSVPFICASMVAGAVADRMNRRKLLLLTQMGLFLVALTQALLVFLGVIQVWHIYLLSALSLTCAGFESAARQSFLPSLVPRKHLASAIALHTSLHRSTAVIGPVLGGIAIASVGVAGALFWNSIGYGLLIASVLWTRVDTPAGSRRDPLWRSIVDGFVHVRERPMLWGLLMLQASASMFATYAAMLPIYARDILEIGPQGLGMLHSMVGAGSIAGMIIFIIYGAVASRGPAILLGSFLYPCLIIGFAISTNVTVSMALLFLAGAVDSVAGTARNTLNQLAVDDRFRGRVMSLSSISNRGLHQLGNVQSGLLASVVGPPVAMVAGGLLAVAYVVWAAVRIPELSGRPRPSAGEGDLDEKSAVVIPPEPASSPR